MKKLFFILTTAILVMVGCSEQSTAPKEEESKAESEANEEKQEPIDVEINVEPVIKKNGKVYFKGETNLPDHAELMFTVSGDNYQGQSKKVVKKGKFKTEKFSADGDSLPAGEYRLSISLSIPSTQNKKFLEDAGESYENLTGDLMEDSELGKMLNYETTFTIERKEEETVNVEEEIDEETVSTEEVKEEEKDDIPKEYESALKKADSYANKMHMSKAGLYDQLTSEHGENFSEEAAQYAVDNVKADWNDNALQKAITYQDSMAMSPNAIYDQLISEHGEQFTEEQAKYAIDNLPN